MTKTLCNISATLTFFSTQITQILKMFADKEEQAFIKKSAQILIISAICVSKKRNAERSVSEYADAIHQESPAVGCVGVPADSGIAKTHRQNQTAPVGVADHCREAAQDWNAGVPPA